jgi:hypothetical protein
MGKSASFAKKKMRENNNNQFRPEQQQMCSELRKEFIEYPVLMEEDIRYQKENGEFTKAIIDIFMPTLGVCYRLNGEIHYTSDRQIEHDWEQKLYLEGLGLMVIDVDTRT